MRWYFTLKQSYLYPKLKKGTLPSLSNICDLTIHELQDSQVKVLLLDFDGVLARHGALLPDEDVIVWLNSLISHWGGVIAFYSNNPFIARMKVCKETFKEIHWVLSPRKKPYPDGIVLACEQFKVKPYEIMVVDDRRLTGILAAVLAGSQPRWLTPARANFKKQPFIEGFFAFLRKMDAWLIDYRKSQ